MDTLTTLENSLVYLVVLAGGHVEAASCIEKGRCGILSALIMNVTLPAAVLKGAANASFNSSFVIIFLSAMLLNVLLLSAGFFFFKGKAWPGTRLDDSQCETPSTTAILPFLFCQLL